MDAKPVRVRREGNVETSTLGVGKEVVKRGRGR